MLGAIPEYLSLALIIEEGLEYRVLETIVDSIPLHAKKAGVHFVTGDIKTVVGTERLVDMLTSEPLPRIC